MILPTEWTQEERLHLISQLSYHFIKHKMSTGDGSLYVWLTWNIASLPAEKLNTPGAKEPIEKALL